MFSALQFAYRQLRRSAGFAATVVLIVSLGVGVTTAMYSVLYAVVLQPSPFAHPDELVALSAKPWDWISIPTIQDWQDRSHSFQSVAAFAGWSPRIVSSAAAGHANAMLVSQNFLSTLGVTPALGRDFTQTGREADCLQQAIISGAYWRRMGGGESLDGRSLQLDHVTYAVVGCWRCAMSSRGPMRRRRS